jgi:hypothetical protein
MTLPCHNMAGHDPATCHMCRLMRDNPKYKALWAGVVADRRPRRQIDPNKPRLPKGVPP